MSTQKEPLRLELVRIEKHYSKNELHNRTIGLLLVEGKFMSYTVEDYDHELDKNNPIATINRVKAKYIKKIAIPAGTYKVTLSDSARFGHNAIGVDDVPGFSGIRIHGGKGSLSSEGCIIVGLSNNSEQNILADYDTLSYDSKKARSVYNEKTDKWEQKSLPEGQKAGNWTPHWLQDLIKLHDNRAIITIRRRYPPKSWNDEMDGLNSEINKTNSKLKTGKASLEVRLRTRMDKLTDYAGVKKVVVSPVPLSTHNTNTQSTDSRYDTENSRIKPLSNSTPAGTHKSLSPLGSRGQSVRHQ